MLHDTGLTKLFKTNIYSVTNGAVTHKPSLVHIFCLDSGAYGFDTIF